MPQDDSSLDTYPEPGVQVAARALVDAFDRALRLALHTGELCRVLAFKPPQPPGGGGAPPLPARVDVQLLQQRQCAVTTPDGREITVAVPMPPMLDVPVFWGGLAPLMAFIPGAAGEGLVGEMGYLCGMSRDREPYCLYGQQAVPFDRYLTHDLNNSFFVPGPRAGADSPTIPAIEAGKVKLGAFDATWALALDVATKALALLTTGPTLDLDAAVSVKVGGLAASPIAKGDVNDANTAALQAAVSAAVIVPGDGGAALKTAILAGFAAGSPTAATKGLVE